MEPMPGFAQPSPAAGQTRLRFSPLASSACRNTAIIEVLKCRNIGTDWDNTATIWSWTPFGMNLLSAGHSGSSLFCSTPSSHHFTPHCLHLVLRSPGPEAVTIAYPVFAHMAFQFLVDSAHATSPLQRLFRSELVLLQMSGAQPLTYRGNGELVHARTTLPCTLFCFSYHRGQGSVPLGATLASRYRILFLSLAAQVLTYVSQEEMSPKSSEKTDRKSITYHFGMTACNWQLDLISRPHSKFG